MKICHVTSLHSPDDARIFHKECVSLAKHHEVWLIAPNVEDYEKGGVKVVGVTLPEGRLKRLFALNKVYEKAKEIEACPQAVPCFRHHPRRTKPNTRTESTRALFVG